MTEAPPTRPRRWVFHRGALGDSVLLWPLLRALRPVRLVTHLEKARLAARWLPGVHPMDVDHPEIARLHVPRAQQEISPPLAADLAEAERIVSFVSDGTDAWARNVAAMAAPTHRCFVRARPPPDADVHVLQWHRRQLRDQGLSVTHEVAPPRGRVAGPVVCHPGSGGRHKCWPLDRFERLLDRLQHRGRPVTVVIGEAELERFPRERLAAWRERYEVVEHPDLTALAERLWSAAAYVGNDAGPTHLAAALGVPTVALFGPTPPRVWAPLGPSVTVLWPGRAAPMDRLRVESVADAVERTA